MGIRKIELARLIANFYNFRKYTDGNGYINTSKRYFVVNCIIKANDNSQSYSATFKCFAGRYYSVYLNGNFNNFKSIPHIFVKRSNKNKINLCLDRYEYDSNEFLTKNVLPWACEWIYFYELYLITGDWFGNGVHPGGEKI